MQDSSHNDTDLYNVDGNNLYEEIDLDPEVIYATPIQNSLIMLENSLYEA